MFETLDELNNTLMRDPRCQYAWLQLDNYLVVVAENEETENYLTSLENTGYLPHTAAWFSQEACKVRLYQRAEGISPGGVLFSGLSMSISTGAGARCRVASPSDRLQDYDDLEDESLVENTPAALDERALRILTSLLFLSDCLSFDDWPF